MTQITLTNIIELVFWSHMGYEQSVVFVCVEQDISMLIFELDSVLQGIIYTLLDKGILDYVMVQNLRSFE